MPDESRPKERVRLADVLRLDVAKVHGAVASRDVEASPAARALLQVIAEPRRRYKTRVLYCPPLPLLWGFASADDSAASRLHRAWARAVWRERGFAGRALLLAAFGVWPFFVAGTSLWLVAVNGGAVRRRNGKGRLRQVAEQVSLAARHGILPPWYYIYELYEDANRARAGEYLRRDETKGGLYRLGREPSAGRLLFDKRRFAIRCHEHGVATPPSLICRRNRIKSHDGGPPTLPRGDLFVKPARGQGGSGTQVWRYDGARWRRGDGPPLDEATLVRRFAELSRSEVLLVQPRLANHPDLADLSFGVLSTVRVMTCRNEAGDYEATHAVYRMPKSPNARVDNIHAGGIAAPIDFANGELGLASDMGLRPDTDWWSHHPHSGVPIRGRKLPFWPETLALARRAHAAFPKWTAIGWDISILESGPVVIEGNSAPDVDLIQRPCRAPLGSSRFGELLAYHLDRAPVAST